MLNQIQFHIDEDEQKQQNIEQEVAKSIQRRHHEGVEAFRRQIPSLLKFFVNQEATSSTIMCNRFGELNIVDIQTGQVLYGISPKEEVSGHLRAYLNDRLDVSVEESGVTTATDTLVVLGLGLGYHLEELIACQKYKNIVVYEPNVDYFICSLSSINWKDILSDAKKAGIALFLQIGSDGSSLYSDISELQEHLGLTKFALYKHFNNPTFDQVESGLKTLTWDEFEHWRFKRTTLNPIVNYISPWTQIKHQFNWDQSFLDESTKLRNLDALKQYFPELYKEFLAYSPAVWEPLALADGSINICYKATGALFYGNAPENEAHHSFKNFTQHPHKDSLVLGYKGKKLRNYTHYQLVTECEKVLQGFEEESGQLPEKVKSTIFFGLAAGYDFEYFVENFDIEKLFICEPNKDFFYASLYSVDWAKILDYFNKKERRLYLNIGDDGSNLINDLLVQFQSIGPYVLANSYFYQSYYNQGLVTAVSQLREQLQVIIAMGDYLDNAKYGLSHTHSAIKHHMPLMRYKPSTHLESIHKEVPVFIVGNGPSLDDLIPLIKEEADAAIIVSCGTALQTLYKHGITPHFHAEIESNRSTYDWAIRVNAPDYLKQISLISCNGIHPDTCNLYKDVYLAFKQGEASTVSIAELYPKKTFGALDAAYPTVTNFAMNLLTEIGFEQFYLFGTDMGFVDENYHHSKSSGYYSEKGNELYDYTAENNTSLILPGNFRPVVKTKYEFKVSKSVLENVLSVKKAEVYNLNDGAKIAGTKPLRKEDAILVCSAAQRDAAVEAMKQQVFKELDFDDFEKRFNNRYDSNVLIEELSQFHLLVPTELESKEDLTVLIEEQRNFVVKSLLNKNSLLFFYLNGTLNYINSSLTKVANLSDETRMISLSSELLSIWKRYLKYIRDGFAHARFELDGITSFMGKRREILLRNYLSSKPFNIDIESSAPIGRNSTFISIVDEYRDQKNPAALLTTNLEPSNKEANQKRYVIVREVVKNIESLFIEDGNSVYIPGSYLTEGYSVSCNDETGLNFAVLSIISGINGVVFVPKLIYNDDAADTPWFDKRLLSLEGIYAYSGSDFLLLSQRRLDEQELLLGNGDRVYYLPHIKVLDILGRKINDEKYQSMKQIFIDRKTR
ncbi:motility associated factor glycosyltransferase family protein [Alteromonas stellipolaris]|uniref:motility associated factor glycosyltransferase family protein n=1 Tax=Alteromonas stellipolaris TaxID=233316 RepID=UPI0026E36125|nr:6-hydroxymethylpterin diphosphokinase MptE-like protein [Alteromonas stellipolaris]MDO6536541.1 DUF115 domain-containing protein [Alteromonas stellipolaris]MDO6625932.1 DUF115 domain-containing protein [Alteromonas stellipolaris]